MKKATVLILLLSKSVSGDIDFDLHLIDPALSFICALFSVVKDIAGPIAALVLAWAGIRWIASRDDPEERKNAKQMLMNVLIGLIIILLAAALVTTISSKTIDCSAYI